MTNSRESDIITDAWGIIANAYGGNWDAASDVWRSAAERWRDQQFGPWLTDCEWPSEVEVEQDVNNMDHPRPRWGLLSS